jgi:transcriptional regulator with XRE-family HTH domain
MVMCARWRINGARVRQWRHERVLSQAELARDAGLSVHAVWEIDLGKALLCRPSTMRA